MINCFFIYKSYWQFSKYIAAFSGGCPDKVVRVHFICQSHEYGPSILIPFSISISLNRRKCWWNFAGLDRCKEMYWSNYIICFVSRFVFSGPTPKALTTPPLELSAHNFYSCIFFSFSYGFFLFFAASFTMY